MTPSCACCGVASASCYASWTQNVEEVVFASSASGRAAVGDVDGLRRALTRGASSSASTREGEGEEFNAFWVNARTGSQATALHAACSGGHSECAERLLRAGADVRAVDVDGESALHKACANGDVTCVSLVYIEGMDMVDARDRRGRTPVELCASRVRTKVDEIFATAGVTHKV
jgi:ankyrin repeat protein